MHPLGQIALPVPAAHCVVSAQQVPPRSGELRRFRVVLVSIAFFHLLCLQQCVIGVGFHLGQPANPGLSVHRLA